MNFYFSVSLSSHPVGELLVGFKVLCPLRKCGCPPAPQSQKVDGCWNASDGNNNCAFFYFLVTFSISLERIFSFLNSTVQSFMKTRGEKNNNTTEAVNV